jgi:hypothetical protein
MLIFKLLKTKTCKYASVRCFQYAKETAPFAVAKASPTCPHDKEQYQEEDECGALVE